MFSTDKAINAILFVCLFTLLYQPVTAQYGPEYSRFGLSLQGGVTLGYPDDVNQVFGSNYNVFTQPTSNYAGGVQYAISPFWSTELGYRYNRIRGISDDGFSTRIHSAAWKNYFNFNRFFRRNRASEWLNPYLIMGYEQDFFRYELNDDFVSGNESALLGGFGLSVRIHHRLELYSQYEVKLANNKLDNENRGLPFDQVGMVNGGIRFRLGKRESKPLSLAPPVKFLTDTEYEDFLARSDRFFGANEEILAQRKKLDEIEAAFAENSNLTERQIEDQRMFSQHLAERISGLEDRVTRLENRQENIEIVHELSLRKEVPAGHYVQVFASRRFESAARVKEQFHSMLDDVLDKPEEMVFVIKRGSYYEVMIGTFIEFRDAASTHRIALARFADAFVITFPRPLHLKDAYEGTEVVWDNQSISSLSK